MIARPVRCAHCQGALRGADQTLAGRYDKVDLPKVAPVVTRVERYAGHCRCCGGTTLAPLPEGLAPGTPFSLNIVALAMYLRFVHAVSYRRLSRLLLELFGLAVSEGALDGLKLIGFSIWERRGGTGRNVTFPARQYSVNGERRSFALLRPVVETSAQNRLRDMILEAFQEYEEQAAIAG